MFRATGQLCYKNEILLKQKFLFCPQYPILHEKQKRLHNKTNCLVTSTGYRVAVFYLKKYVSRWVSAAVNLRLRDSEAFPLTSNETRELSQFKYHAKGSNIKYTVLRNGKISGT